MRSVDSAIEFVVGQIPQSCCLECIDDPEDSSRVYVRFQHGRNRTRINITRKRLSQIDSRGAQGIIATIRASLHRSA